MDSSVERLVLVGIGNPDRGDDAAGRIAVRSLRGQVPSLVEIIEQSGEPSALLSVLAEVSMAIIVDASRSGALAGTLQRLDANAGSLPRYRLDLSSHGIGVAEAIELARALGQLPSHCIIHTIEGACFDFGAPLSPPVQAGLSTIAERISQEFDAFKAGAS